MLAVLLALLACPFATPAREVWPQLAEMVKYSGAVCPVVLPTKKASPSAPPEWVVENDSNF
jgi:hypothetical protein